MLSTNVLSKSNMITQKDIDKTCVIIPAYNEATVIDEVIKDVQKHFKHVLVIDDNSTDKTAATAFNAGATVLHHDINLGQGAALQTGFDFITQQTPHRYIATFDADGQHQAEDIIKLLNALKTTNSDIAFGSRFTGTAINMPPIRRAFLKLCSFYPRLVLKMRLTDCHNGLRVMTAQAAEKLELRQNGMAHASEIINQASRLKLNYTETPITINYTEYSKSKGQSLWNSLFILRNLLLQRILR